MKESYYTTPVQAERSRNTQESFDYLNTLLGKVAGDISRELEEKYGTKKLISSDCSIRMEAFKALDGEQVKEDREFIKKKEREWAGIKETEDGDGLEKQPDTEEERDAINAQNDKQVRDWSEKKKNLNN